MLSTLEPRKAEAEAGASAAPGGSGVAGPGLRCPLAAAAPAAAPAPLGSPHLQDASPAVVGPAQHRNSLAPSALGMLAVRGTGTAAGTSQGSEGKRLVARLVTDSFPLSVTCKDPAPPSPAEARGISEVSWQ